MTNRAAPSFDLGKLKEEIRLAALDLSGQTPDRALTGARFVDGLRDAGQQAPTLDEWSAQVETLDDEAWNRLEILVRLFRHGSQSTSVQDCLRADASRARTAFSEFCVREARLLTVELLLKSPFRVEELARKWIHALGATIEGESAKESAAQRERLDFGGVLKSLEAADKDREARMARLRKLEEERRRQEQEAYMRGGRE